MFVTKSISINESSGQDGFSACPSCGTSKHRIEPAPPPHHQKLVCAECDRFIKWLPSPQSIQRHNEIKGRLKALLSKQNELSKWNADFIEGLWLDCGYAELENKLIKLSPRQLVKLAEIEASMMGSDNQ